MRYLSINEISDITGLTPRRIQQMCKSGDIPGAVKDGRCWSVPEDVSFVSDNIAEYGAELSRKKKAKLPLPVGVSGYIEAVTNYYYVDKTLLIRDFIDTLPKVSLFTRPRRFGKTLTMDMLKVFFEKTPDDTSVYFRDKQIWKCGAKYRSYQGQYPVVYLSFKDVKHRKWTDALEDIRANIAAEYARHPELGSSDRLSAIQREYYAKACGGHMSEIELAGSLKNLSQLLCMHYGKPAVIMVDEYDTPIQQGYNHGYYDEIIALIRNLFSGAFKDNPNLAYGFLTGVLRVAKESIFSGLNNLKVNSIMDKRFDAYFGFTADEVMRMLSYYGQADRFDEVAEWYDGYRFGNAEIFNPWSVINYIDDECTPKAFWQSTGSNDIIGEIIANSTPDILADLRRLLQGDSVSTYVDLDVIYPEIRDNPSSIYSFLLVTGYLKNTEISPQEDGGYICKVSVPNREIAYVYAKEVISRSVAGCSEPTAVQIGRAIFDRDGIRLEAALSDYLMRSVSYYDTADEAFYQGLMMGLCAMLNARYEVRSNRESGLGRFDIQLRPYVSGLPAFLIEIKVAESAKESLDGLAGEALRQIEDKKYDTELKAAGIKDIRRIGVAFYGKKAGIKVQK